MFSYIRHLGFTLLIFAVVALLGCDSGGSSDDNGDDPPPDPSGAEVTVAENDSLGEYLADADGVSLYLFVDEEGEPAPCTSDECLGAWPVFSTEGEPVAGDGVDASLLSTTAGPDGTDQVVYNGWPLWYFVNDNSSGDVNGQGIVSFGGTWLLVSPAGEGIEATGGNGGDAQVAVAENDSLGEYLVDADGFSLYLFVDEEGNPAPCTGDCLDNWPVFATDGEPAAGDGVDAALLGTTERSDGTIQVVYNDWPLYYFANDSSPGDVNGQGLGPDDAKWYLVSPAGDGIMASGGDENGGDDGGDGGSDDPRY